MQEIDQYDVIVVGAGASGLMASIAAAERGKKVLLIEKMDQAGRKLRITGKGRCNLTNKASIQETLPHIGSDARFLRNAYGAFFNKELCAFFEQRNVPLKIERGGRVFPESNKAFDVFIALITDIEHSPLITVRKNMRIGALLSSNNHVTGVLLQNSRKVYAKSVILATGGMSYPLTGSTGDGYTMLESVGHTVIPCVPSLVPLVCAEKIDEKAVGFVLKNVGMQAFDSNGKCLFDQVGECTFTDNGLGGPMSLSLSRLLSRRLSLGERFVVRIDLKTALDFSRLKDKLQRDFDSEGRRIFKDALRIWLPPELIPMVLSRMHVEHYKRLNQVSSAQRDELCKVLKQLDFTVVGTRGFKEAITTQGGVKLSEVNPKTMESKIVQGLYIVGELLDLDADTGGYNLQIAFSTGHAAGSAC